MEHACIYPERVNGCQQHRLVFCAPDFAPPQQARQLVLRSLATALRCAVVLREHWSQGRKSLNLQVESGCLGILNFHIGTEHSHLHERFCLCEPPFPLDFTALADFPWTQSRFPAGLANPRLKHYNHSGCCRASSPARMSTRSLYHVRRRPSNNERSKAVTSLLQSGILSSHRRKKDAGCEPITEMAAYANVEESQEAPAGELIDYDFDSSLQKVQVVIWRPPRLKEGIGVAARSVPSAQGLCGDDAVLCFFIVANLRCLVGSRVSSSRHVIPSGPSCLKCGIFMSAAS